MPRNKVCKKFGVVNGSKAYYRKQHEERLKAYGLREYYRPRKCCRCTRKSTILHAPTGLTMQCWMIARELGAACDGTPMPELRLPQFIEAAIRTSGQLPAPAEIDQPGAKRTDLDRCDETTNPAA